MPSLGQNRVLEKATKRYQKQLSEVRPRADPHGAIPYLAEHNIGFHLAQKYRLGLITDPIPGDEDFAGFLVIPYLTPAGVRAIKYRNLHWSKGSDAPKCAAPQGQKARLYNTQAYFDTDTVIGVTEGEIDAVCATEFLGLPSIGIPGADHWHAFEKVWGPLFKDYQTVIVFRDGDRAGRDLAKDMKTTLPSRVKVYPCPEGEDVSSMIYTGRAQEILDWWQKAIKEDDDDAED